MKKSKIQDFLKVDIIRIITNRAQLYLILGVVLSLFFSLESFEDIGKSVLYLFDNATSRIGNIIIFIFCTCAYAPSLSEDLETHYLRYTIIRGNLRKYIISKVLVIFVSAVIIMTLGCILFAIIASFFGPWQDTDTAEFIINYGLYGWAINSGHILVWIALYSFQRGILAGILALSSTYLSLFVPNKMLVITGPALIYQVILECGYGIYSKFSILDPIIIFNANYSTIKSDFMAFLWALTVGIISSLILVVAISKKIRGKL